MRRLLAILSVAAALPLTLPASEFDWLVREFSRQSAAKPVHIPLFGLARFAVATAHPAGASELHLAVFQDVELESARFSETTDRVVGPAWRPIVRVRSRNGESTNIYAQLNGKDLRVLLTVLDGGEATFVEVRLKPEALMKFVDEHGPSRQQASLNRHGP
jgi:hypothetical protein